MTIRKGGNIIAGYNVLGDLSNPFYLGQSMYSASEPNNASWLKSAGQWNNGSVYASFYTWLLGIYNGTITGTGVSVKAAGDVSITAYDFVIDTVNTQFKLPTLDGSEDLMGDTYDSLTLGTSGTWYTAPANGWYTISKAGNNGEWVYIGDSTSQATVFVIGTSAGYAQGLYPVKKGKQVQIGYTANGGVDFFNFIYAKGNGSLYYYIGETVQDANIIAAAGVLTDIANLKAHYVTETYVNGTSWYRVWSDGYIEQGGYVASQADSVTRTIDYLKPLTTTVLEYNIHNTRGSGADQYAFQIGVTADPGLSSMSVRTVCNATTNYIWSVRGY